jgi:hypothetical protein
VSVSTIPIGKAPPIEGKLRLIVKAEIIINSIEVDRDGFIIIPEKSRRQCEVAIETAANIISVFSRCGRSISSAFPYVALIIDEPKERVHLNKTKGFRDKPITLATGHHFQIDLNDNHVSGLLDRLEGVALLAQAFCHRMESGRFREFVRFFEAAFSRIFTQVQRNSCNS